ncbi:MAG: ribosome-associated translation inhibitor RaiA [Thermoleophilia bacterium]|nr:ribosome-associated translation inhibitor RaiA [Thermoleophilia bacterium]
MKLLVKGKNIHVSGNIQAYAEKRLGKLSKQLDDDVTRLELEIAEEKNPRVADSHVAEVTIWTKGPTMRAREASHDIYAAIDLVAEKLQRQVLKYREKRIQYQHHGGPHAGKGRWKGALQDNGNGAGELLPGSEFTTDVQEDLMAEAETVSIIKSKQFLLGPLSPEEAALQMSLVGHDFFLFVNSENNQTSVLYKRADGHYGLIEPALAEAEAS